LLREIESEPKNSLAKQLHDVAMQMRRKSIVVLISDLFSDIDDVLKGLDHLRFDGHSVIVLHTLDPYEIEFPFSGAWKFNGLEGEEPLKTQPERIREDYLKNFNKYLETIRQGCISSHIDYEMVDTSRPLDAVLCEFLVNRESTLNGISAGARL
jgi:hypothetical protein